jgi:RNA polymerase sigma factor (sigma-70 family)
MPSEPDPVLLRRYHAAQDAGDHETVAEVWDELAVNNFDRMKQIVKAFRFSPGGPGIAPDEQGSAVSEVYMRVHAMGAHFRKREVGQYYAALVTTTHHTCMDFGRKELRHGKHSAGSVDQTFDPDGEAGRYDAALAAYDAELRQRSTDAVEDELQKQETEQLVAWAVGHIANDKHREVLALTFTNRMTAEQIAEQLGISLANVYQRRSRGLKELEQILRDFKG